MTKNLTVSWKSHYPTPICEKYFFEQVSKVYLCLLVAVNSFLAHRLETPVVKKNRRACSSEIWEINPRAIKILFCGSGLNVFHLYEVTIHKKNTLCPVIFFLTQHLTEEPKKFALWTFLRLKRFVYLPRSPPGSLVSGRRLTGSKVVRAFGFSGNSHCKR